MIHTPGPWKVRGNIGRKSELGIVADAAPCIIAIMGNQKEWPVEAQANARLIAAAPDLLAALGEVTALARKLAMASPVLNPEVDHILPAADAAIAKATA